ncbi:hypothetical protein [Caulobacter endophyticus]|uniref:Uncharacterized protein n=1 Tax=Caulobacter endophyticus TaxID=2172652 RepID=A0A2T9K403_9CAUL|nr:hypothetical protein [Caulobacter endophyticus]PVM90705.1 hypothetical protein DDF67_09780 [Caulobacter endophyticus]
MSILGNLFSDDSSNSSDLLGVLNVVGDVGVDYSYESGSTDDDGQTETSWGSGSFGTDFDLGSVLGSATDSASDSDGGGLF